MIGLLTPILRLLLLFQLTLGPAIICCATTCDMSARPAGERMGCGGDAMPCCRSKGACEGNAAGKGHSSTPRSPTPTCPLCDSNPAASATQPQREAGALHLHLPILLAVILPPGLEPPMALAGAIAAHAGQALAPPWHVPLYLQSGILTI